MIFQSLQFWVLLAGLLAFVAWFFFPAFPFDQAQILALALFLLGLIGIVPQARAFLAAPGDILRSRAFWTLIAGLVSFILHFFAPDFPLSDAALLGVILFVLAQVGIVPELRARGLLADHG